MFYLEIKTTGNYKKPNGLLAFSPLCITFVFFFFFPRIEMGMKEIIVILCLMLLSLSMEAIQPGEADEGKHNYILKPNSHGRRFSSLNHLKNL